MSLRSILAIAGTGLLMAPLALAAPTPLLISEVYFDADDETFGDADETGEFVEIFNPTGAPVALDDYYISDVQTYWNLPAQDATPGILDGAGSGDFCLRFPAGATIPAGGVVVVFNGGINWTTREGGLAITPGTVSYEAFNSSPAIADMLQASTGASTLSFTNGGEFIVLFHWDGASDLVTDIDFVQYAAPAGANLYLLKTSANTVDGPDGDAIASAYANEGPSGTNAPGAGTSNDNDSIIRTTIVEAGESATGGNGIGGANEPTENLGTSFTLTAANGATPGSFPSSLPTELSSFSIN